MKFLKNIFLRLIYPHSFSSEKYVDYLRHKGATIGENTYIYGSHKARIDISNARFIRIGKNCLITEGVIILAHDYSYAVVANVYNEMLRNQRETVLGNNVFVGMNSIILMGATVGDNVIIGAGSVVSGNLDSNSVYAGNPARKICSLEQYYRKLQSGFENSAKIYASKCKDVKNMGIYRVFYESEEDYINYISQQTFHGIDANVIKNMEISPVVKKESVK